MAPIGRRLPTLLVAYSAGALQQMLAGREIDLEDRHKAAALAALEAAAADPASVARMVEALSEEQRRLLDLLLLYPGEVSTAYVRDAALAAGLIDRSAASRAISITMATRNSPRRATPPPSIAAGWPTCWPGSAGACWRWPARPPATRPRWTWASPIASPCPARFRHPGGPAPAGPGPIAGGAGPVEAADPRRAHRALF